MKLQVLFALANL